MQPFKWNFLCRLCCDAAGPRKFSIRFSTSMVPQETVNDSQIHLCLTYAPFLMKLKLRTAENLNQFKSKRKLICFSSCIFNLSVDCEIALFKSLLFSDYTFITVIVTRFINIQKSFFLVFNHFIVYISC